MKVLKKIIVSLLILLVICGCSYSSSRVNADYEQFEYRSSMKIDGFGYYNVTDKDTRVSYLIIAGSSGVSVTPLYNSDGTLKVD